VLRKIADIGTNRWYWLGMIIIGLGLEAGALFYQYVLDYAPCILCIHVRLWIFGFVIVAVLGLFTRTHWYTRLACHLLSVAMMAGFLERSWMTLGVERGWVLDECSMDLGLPAWLAVDEWLPVVFRPLEACGYTPVLPFGITMAEALVLIAGMLLLVTVLMTAATLLSRRVPGPG
jgi:disulfide bond formation protein DsbB